MKIKAYQIAPEYQESPLYMFNEMPDGLEICGNRAYKRHTSDTFDEVIKCLEYGDFSDFEFTGYKAERLEELCNKYGTRGADDEGIIAGALSIVTGQKWENKQICGIVNPIGSAFTISRKYGRRRRCNILKLSILTPETNGALKTKKATISEIFIRTNGTTTGRKLKLQNVLEQIPKK